MSVYQQLQALKQESQSRKSTLCRTISGVAVQHIPSIFGTFMVRPSGMEPVMVETPAQMACWIEARARRTA